MNMPILQIFSEPARHLNIAAGGSNGRQPLCGQVGGGGYGYARTKYTTDKGAVTCLRCLRSIRKRGWLVAANPNQQACNRVTS